GSGRARAPPHRREPVSPFPASNTCAMTDHPDLETLSAALDGEATAAVRAHVDDCPTCREELATLAGVQAAVGAAPPPAPPGAEDRAVAAAVRSTVPRGRLSKRWVAAG